MMSEQAEQERIISLYSVQLSKYGHVNVWAGSPDEAKELAEEHARPEDFGQANADPSGIELAPETESGQIDPEGRLYASLGTPLPEIPGKGHLGHRLKVVREFLGLTQGDVARWMGVAQGTVWNVENGETNNLDRYWEYRDALAAIRSQGPNIREESRPGGAGGGRTTYWVCEDCGAESKEGPGGISHTGECPGGTS